MLLVRCVERYLGRHGGNCCEKVCRLYVLIFKTQKFSAFSAVFLFGWSFFCARLAVHLSAVHSFKTPFCCLSGRRPPVFTLESLDYLFVQLSCVRVFVSFALVSLLISLPLIESSIVWAADFCLLFNFFLSFEMFLNIARAEAPLFLWRRHPHSIRGFFFDKKHKQISAKKTTTALVTLAGNWVPRLKIT